MRGECVSCCWECTCKCAIGVLANIIRDMSGELDLVQVEMSESPSKKSKGDVKVSLSPSNRNAALLRWILAPHETKIA